MSRSGSKNGKTGRPVPATMPCLPFSELSTGRSNAGTFRCLQLQKSRTSRRRLGGERCSCRPNGMKYEATRKTGSSGTCLISCGRPAALRWNLAVHPVDLDNAMAVFPPSEAKGEQHERVIFMPDEALEICRRLISGQMWPSPRTNRRHRSSDPWSMHEGKCEESMQSDQSSLFWR